jgi:hypothetical protein
MVDSRVLLDVSVTDDGEHAVAVHCTDCGVRVTLWPDEAVITQVKAFLSLHQHDQ